MQPRVPIIDVSSAADALPAEEVRAWAAGKRMFISSVMNGLQDQRNAAATAIESIGAEPVRFETFGGRDESAEAAYLAEVASSDVYVGILAAAYGSLLPSGRSATHDEYLEAETRGLHVSVWVDTGASREPRQAELLEAIRAMHTTGSFGTPDEFDANLRRRLGEIAAEDLSPWIKLGPVVIRALRIAESSRSAHIVARTRDDDIIEAIRQLDGGLSRLGTGTQLLTVGGRTRKVVIKSVATETVAGMTKSIDVDLEVLGAPDGTPVPSFGVGLRTYSPMELGELAIRRALGQSDEDIQATEMMTGIGNPFDGLAEARLPAGSMSAVAGLLLTEALAANGFAGRVPRFRMGPPAHGRRLVDVTWEDLKRYSNVGPERRRLQTELPWSSS